MSHLESSSCLGQGARGYHVTYLVLHIHWVGEARDKRIRMRLAQCTRDIFACCDWPIRVTLQS